MLLPEGQAAEPVDSRRFFSGFTFLLKDRTYMLPVPRIDERLRKGMDGQIGVLPPDDLIDGRPRPAQPFQQTESRFEVPRPVSQQPVDGAGAGIWDSRGLKRKLSRATSAKNRLPRDAAKNPIGMEYFCQVKIPASIVSIIASREAIGRMKRISISAQKPPSLESHSHWAESLWHAGDRPSSGSPLSARQGMPRHDFDPQIRDPR